MSEQQEATRRPRVPRADGWVEPEEPQVELPTEDCHLTMVGARVYVSRYLNEGKPIEKGQTIFCTPTMAGLLLTNTWVDRRTNEKKPYFRYATDVEIQAFEQARDVSNPMTADRAALARKAREEQVDAGQASFEAESQHASEEAIKDTRAPRKRKRSRSED